MVNEKDKTQKLLIQIQLWKSNKMIKSINFEHLPVKDLLHAGLLIFVMAVIISNIYNPLWAFLYAFGNLIVLTFLGWLYEETWSDPKKQSFINIKTHNK